MVVALTIAMKECTLDSQPTFTPLLDLVKGEKQFKFHPDQEHNAMRNMPGVETRHHTAYKNVAGPAVMSKRKQRLQKQRNLFYAKRYFKINFLTFVQFLVTFVTPSYEVLFVHFRLRFLLFFFAQFFLRTRN